jgi:hypothetical protein
VGATWLEIETLVKRFEAVETFAHADALPAVSRARVSLAEAAVAVSLAGLSDDPRADAETLDLLARARYLVGEAEAAVHRAQDAVIESRRTSDEARRRIAEARLLRARDHVGPAVRLDGPTTTLPIASRPSEPERTLAAPRPILLLPS